MDGGLRGAWPTRPAGPASYPVSVRRVASLLHASFGRSLAGPYLPLRFTSTSPPSGCAGDFHPQAVEHARHTTLSPPPEARTRVQQAKLAPWDEGPLGNWELFEVELRRFFQIDQSFFDRPAL